MYMVGNKFEIRGLIAEEPAPYLISGSACARSKLRINERSEHVQLANLVAEGSAAEDLLKCAVGDRVLVLGHLGVSKKTNKLQLCADSVQPTDGVPRTIPCTHHMQFPAGAAR